MPVSHEPGVTRGDVSRWIMAVVFVAAGAAHFANPTFYTAMFPPWMPEPNTVVLVTGALEVAGGIGLLVPQLRAAAAQCLWLFLLGVWPLHIYMAVYEVQPGGDLPSVGAAALWVRVVLQAPLVGWAWLVWRSVR